MSKYTETYGTVSPIKALFKAWGKGQLTREKVYQRSKKNILWHFDAGEINQNQADACIKKIDEWYAGKVGDDAVVKFVNLVFF